MSELTLDPQTTAVVVIDIQKGIVGMPGAPHPTSRAWWRTAHVWSMPLAG